MSPLSAAMARFDGPDIHSPWHTNFRYSPISGLVHDAGVTRRDPGCILLVGGRYYVWYTRHAGPAAVGLAQISAPRDFLLRRDSDRRRSAFV